MEGGGSCFFVRREEVPGDVAWSVRETVVSMPSSMVTSRERGIIRLAEDQLLRASGESDGAVCGAEHEHGVVSAQRDGRSVGCAFHRNRRIGSQLQPTPPIVTAASSGSVVTNTPPRCTAAVRDSFDQPEMLRSVGPRALPGFPGEAEFFTI